MTDLPYTDADLRAEAARQHQTATEDPDFSGIVEQMEGHKIPSRDDFQWDQLDEDDFDEAQRSIDDLLGNAADTSTLAIDLGADGLEPSSDVIHLDNADGPFVRLHLAFHPGMAERDRERFTAGLKQTIADAI